MPIFKSHLKPHKKYVLILIDPDEREVVYNHILTDVAIDREYEGKPSLTLYDGELTISGRMK